MELNSFWAKTQPFQSVVTHGIVSGTVCRYLMTEYLSAGSRDLVAGLLGLTDEELLDFTAYLASLHDIGKLEYHFQCKDQEMKKRLRALGADKAHIGHESVRHEKTGARVLTRIWEQQNQDEDALNIFSSLIGAHHQKNHGLNSIGKDSFFDGYQREFDRIMRCRFFSDRALPEISDDKEGVFESLLLGMVILSDWIASGSMFSDAEDWVEQEDSAGQIIRRTEEFLSGSGLKKETVNWDQSFTEVWPWISSRERKIYLEKESVTG